MVDFLVWRDAWLIGIEPLDDDHKTMVRLLNQIAATMEVTPASGTSSQAETLLSLIDQLLSHIREHFEVEQHFMEEIDFPGYQGHKSEHAMQMASLTTLQRKLTESGAPPRISQTDLQEIKAWFFDHVVGEDRRFAEYYLTEVCGQKL